MAVPQYSPPSSPIPEPSPSLKKSDASVNAYQGQQFSTYDIHAYN
jgi:hypothetical protein